MKLYRKKYLNIEKDIFKNIENEKKYFNIFKARSLANDFCNL